MLLLLRIFSRLASRLSLLMDPSSNSVFQVSQCDDPPSRVRSELTSHVLDTFGHQEGLDEIQHTRKLTEDNRLLLIIPQIDLLQELENLPDFC